MQCEKDLRLASELAPAAKTLFVAKCAITVEGPAIGAKAEIANGTATSAILAPVKLMRPTV